MIIPDNHTLIKLSNRYQDSDQVDLKYRLEHTNQQILIKMAIII